MRPIRNTGLQGHECTERQVPRKRDVCAGKRWGGTGKRSVQRHSLWAGESCQGPALRPEQRPMQRPSDTKAWGWRELSHRDAALCSRAQDPASLLLLTYSSHALAHSLHLSNFPSDLCFSLTIPIPIPPVPTTSFSREAGSSPQATSHLCL